MSKKHTRTLMFFLVMLSSVQLMQGQVLISLLLGDKLNSDKLKFGLDGGINFGAKAPKAKENNWIQTIPGKGWFIYFRFYSPLNAYTDQTWKPDDIEVVK